MGWLPFVKRGCWHQNSALAESVAKHRPDGCRLRLGIDGVGILQNYQGEISTYVILKEIVSRFPDDARKMNGVRVSVDCTGVVSGELGFVETWRAKKESLTEWLADERPAVKSFAEKHIAELELMISSEQRRTESEREIRKRSYDSDDEYDDGAGNQGEQ